MTAKQTSSLQVNQDGNPYRQREQVVRQQLSSPSPPPPPPAQSLEGHYRQGYQQAAPQTPPPPPMSPSAYGNNLGNGMRRNYRIMFMDLNSFKTVIFI